MGGCGGCLEESRGSVRPEDVCIVRCDGASKGRRECVVMTCGWILKNATSNVSCVSLWTATNDLMLYKKAAVQAFAGKNGWLRCYFELRIVKACGCALKKNGWVKFGVRL